MAPNASRSAATQSIGVGGPFDPTPTHSDMIRSIDRFLKRTALYEYAEEIRLGAFLARRPFGTEQIKHLKRMHEEEDLLNRKSSNPNDDASDGERARAEDHTDTKVTRRREYMYRHLESEGDRGRWQIYRRQNWHVHALILCCSLGAAIQGWDESAVNGGEFDEGESS
ncbi:uncharacterized protein KY384_002199 [Bacidia gigantensis]|uniref:uncharacterized protein n=1 Tax=Bacidia gigantensis TaxID=2732470 RepID=UPI001D0489C4|nr:uncharacterized protein KY384_002199 [Bacidia gigantensis]KAG8533416.1 hypothetical protein KY384_002199 [Bacidia gigantensis]